MAWPQTHKRKVILIIAQLIIILGVTSVFLWKKSNDGPSLPKSVSNQIEFATFLPNKPPSGYSIDESSYTITNEALIVKVNTPQNKTVLFSQQPEPGSFDISGFHDILKDKQSVETPYGTAYIGKSENTKVGSLVTAGSWVFLSAPPDTDSEILKTLLKSIVRVE